MNVCYGTFPSGLGEADPDPWCVCGRFEVLCMDLALLRLGKGMMLKLQFTETSLVAFMGNTEFIQVHRMTELLKQSLQMKLHCSE